MDPSLLDESKIKAFWEISITDIILNTPILHIAIIIWFIVLLIALGIIIISRCKRGDILKIGPFTLSQDKKYQQLQETYQRLCQQYNELNCIAEQKSEIMKLFDNWISSIRHLMTASNQSEFADTKKSLYNFVLEGIVSIITKDVNNMHRASILIPDCEKILMLLYHGSGFSPEFKKELSLPINDSIAGKVFRSGKQYCCSDVTKDNLFYVDPKSEREIKSLICHPIRKAGQVVAVLSLDGIKENSFDVDEKAYIEYSANLIGLIMELEDACEEILINNLERRINDERQSRTQTFTG